MPQEPIRPTPITASRESLRRELGAGFRRAIGLTALGTVLPGTGLTQTRSKRLGWALFVVFLAIVATAAYFVLTRGTMVTALDLVSRPDLVQQIGIGFAVCGLVWCASIVLTAVRSKPALLDRRRTRMLTAFTTVMVLLVAGLSYKVAEYATITKDTVQQVFGPSTATPGDGAKLVQGEDPWRDTPRVNVLLLGSDAGVGREGTRTDSMIVASIDTKTGKTVLISLPRNLENAPLPPHSPLRQLYPSGTYGEPTCFRAQKDAADQCMLNAIWMEVDQYVLNHPNAYQGEAVPGRDEVRNVIGEILGLKIDHTVVIDLKGFEQLVDAMGGVEVNVKLGGKDGDQPLPYGKEYANGTYSGYFTKPGLEHLTGYEALWYARTRAADDDFFRQIRQRCVVRAIVQQVNPASMLPKYAEVAKIATDNIYTDIPAASLPAFVELIQRVQEARISSVALSPSNGIYSGHPDYDLIHELVDTAINPPAHTQTSSTGTATKTPTKTATKTRTPSTSTTSTGPVDECA